MLRIDSRKGSPKSNKNYTIKSKKSKAVLNIIDICDDHIEENKK